MKLKIHHNGFHGHNQATVQVRDEDYCTDWRGISGYAITRRQAIRANRKVCGCADCTCGEHIATCIGGREETWIIETERINYQPEGRAVASPTINMQGNYPQA